MKRSVDPSNDGLNSKVGSSLKLKVENNIGASQIPLLRQMQKRSNHLSKVQRKIDDIYKQLQKKSLSFADLNYQRKTQIDGHRIQEGCPDTRTQDLCFQEKQLVDACELQERKRAQRKRYVNLVTLNGKVNEQDILNADNDHRLQRVLNEDEQDQLAMIRKIYSKLNRFQSDPRTSGSQTLEQRVNNWSNVKAQQHQRVETPLKGSVNHMEKNLRIPTKLK